MRWLVFAPTDGGLSVVQDVVCGRNPRHIVFAEDVLFVGSVGAVEAYDLRDGRLSPRPAIELPPELATMAVDSVVVKM